jgi:hypothetical protein
MLKCANGKGVSIKLHNLQCVRKGVKIISTVITVFAVFTGWDWI